MTSPLKVLLRRRVKIKTKISLLYPNMNTLIFCTCFHLFSMFSSILNHFLKHMGPEQGELDTCDVEDADVSNRKTRVYGGSVLINIGSTKMYFACHRCTRVRISIYSPQNRSASSPSKNTLSLYSSYYNVLILGVCQFLVPIK